MYSKEDGCKYIAEALTILGHTAHVINGFKENECDVYTYIKKSPIKHWIFSGSACYVKDPKSKQVPLGLLALKEKCFMMICYSMESVLVGLGYPLSNRIKRRRELFYFTVPPAVRSQGLFTDMPIRTVMLRNHLQYFVSRRIGPPVNLMASYHGEAMMLSYKNSLLVQFHPEKTIDGILLIKNWLVTCDTSVSS